MRIQFLALHRPGRSPSQRYRIEQFLEPLHEVGFETVYTWLLNAEDDKRFYQSGGIAGKAGIVFKSIATLLREVPNPQADIVFVQREAIMLGTTVFEKLISRKSKLVYDFDDSIWMLDVSEGNRRFAFLKNPEKTSKLIGMADLVLAGNQYLVDYASGFNSNVMLMPTVVDTNWYRPAAETDDDSTEANPITIGWSGSATTVKHYREILPALYELKDKYGDRIRFALMGDPGFHDERLEVSGLAWSEDAEIDFLRSLDIGIMPIPDDKWSRGKCGLKGLVYMSCGIPAVLSPVGVNSEIIEDGENGLLASTVEEWVSALSRLIDSAETRRKLGSAGRETVMNRYSVEAWKNPLIGALKQLIE